MPEDLISTTVVIKVDPLQDEAIHALTQEARKVKQFAEARVIASDADLSPATEDLSLIAKLKKVLTEKKAEYYKPIKAHLDAVSAAFQTILTPVEEADKITRDKIMAYRAEQARKAREAEEINRLRMEAARKEMELKGELTESVNLMEAPPPPIHKVMTDLGTASTMKIYKWELVDIKLVPTEYLMLNGGMVTKVVNASKGKVIIPGIKITEEETLRITTH